MRELGGSRVWSAGLYCTVVERLARTELYWIMFRPSGPEEMRSRR